MEKILRDALPNGNFDDVLPKHTKLMKKVRGKGNRSTEWKLRASLIAHGISGWVLHPDELPGKPDFYFDSKNLAVFVDGCFWHGCPQCGHLPKKNLKFWKLKIQRNRERDSEKTRKLLYSGISVIRIWEHEVNNSPSNCVKRIKDYIYAVESGFIAREGAVHYEGIPKI